MEDIQKFHTVRGYQIIDKNKKMLTSAMEDYLEMIYRNSLKEGYTRVNILSTTLNVKASSVTKMVQRLTAIGLLNYQKYGIIFLTQKGKELGEVLLRRHEVVERFLILLGVKENILEETELIEHNISSNTLHRIDLLNQFFSNNPEIDNNLKDFIQ